MQTVQLNVSHLKAALTAAGKSDIRYYLNGVLAEIRKRDVLLVATDGHRLIVVRTSTAAAGEPDNVPAQIIVPRDTLKGIKAMRGVQCCYLDYDAEQQMAECKLHALADGGRTFKPIDGKFPDYSRVIPEKLNGEPGKFDPYFLADMTDALRLITGNIKTYPNVYPNGEGSAVVTNDAAPEFLGVMMPMRWEQGEYTLPEWLKRI